MLTMTENTYLGVQFTPVGKIYHFAAPTDSELEVGYYVLVNTARGKQMGKVAVLNVTPAGNPDEIQLIERVATAKDLMQMDALSDKEKEAVEQVANFLRHSRWNAVKIMDAEYSFDSTRLSLFLNYEPESGFDIKSFLREVSHLFKDVRLEVRQVGPRDVAKFISGLGACGIEKRCCSRFLTEFSSISIKMAKSQDISLTPAEITGICGRLRCCLIFEHEMYEEARKNLPKRKKVVQTPLGEGKVVQVLPLSDSIVVDLPGSGPRQFTRQELETGVLVDNTPKPVFNQYEIPDDDEDVEMVRIESGPKLEQRRPQPQGSRGRRLEGREGDKPARSEKPSGAPNTERDQRGNRGRNQGRRDDRRGGNKEGTKRPNQREARSTTEGETTQPQNQGKPRPDRFNRNRPK